MKLSLNVFTSSMIAAFSSFTFGLYLTSVGLFYPKLKSNYEALEFKTNFDIYFTIFATIVFLGAFFSSFYIYFFDSLSKRNLLIFNNLFYFVGGFLLLKFLNVYLGVFSRFVIGLGAGISCCSVPGYIFLISDNTNRGFYMSFNSIGIISGLIVGKIIDVNVPKDHWESAVACILFYIVVHSVALSFLDDVHPKQDKDNLGQRTIFELLGNSAAFKSIALAISFHIAQHACGIDYFSIFIEDLFNGKSHPGLKSILCLCFSALTNVCSARYIDKLGRKPIIILSSSIILLSTAIMGSGTVTLPLALLYMFGFNVGLSSIPWFISNEIFPYEYSNASQRLSVGINWLSAFFLSLFLKPAHDYYKNGTFFLYSFSMMVFIIIVLLFFKETKGRSIGFQ